ncbi:MAG TPA: FkbM family methyltransferase, partial [Thermoanaerobaculia bacterium]
GLEHRHYSVRARLQRPVRFDMLLDLHSWLQRLAFVDGGYEEDTVEFLLELRRMDGRGAALLDVGANIGIISIPFARKSSASVVAVEAVPDNVARLRTNIELNALDELVQVVPFALGATAGTVQIQVEGDLNPGEGSGTANILPDGSTYECVRQEIVVRTLDELVESGELRARCSVVKIDTDGYDLKVLQGATRFLQRDRPVIFGEFSAQCLAWHEQTVGHVVAFAREQRYETWYRMPRTWHFTREAPAAFDQDLLLVPAESATTFATFLRRGK